MSQPPSRDAEPHAGGPEESWTLAVLIASGRDDLDGS